ncbi:MAG TPA: histidine phosphatase family protein [Tepidisphaeraceae bacterium]|jgi:probable phosphoglycerate mutase
MNTLILVRHGQSDQHLRDITGGWTDAHLTELGRQQSLRIAQRLMRLLDGRPAKLFSSDLARAAETAKIIADTCGLEATLYEELRDMNNGDAADLSLAAAKEIEQPITDPIHDWVAYPRGESWRMMTERVYGFLELLNPLVADTGIIVTHGNAGVAIIQWWLGLQIPCVPAISFQLDPGSITILAVNFWSDRTIRKLNDTSHLRQGDILLPPQPPHLVE